MLVKQPGKQTPDEALGNFLPKEIAYQRSLAVKVDPWRSCLVPILQFYVHAKNAHAYDVVKVRMRCNYNDQKKRLDNLTEVSEFGLLSFIFRRVS